MLPVLLLLAITTAAGLWLWFQRHHRDRLWRWAWLVPAIALLTLAVLVATDLYLQKIVGMLLMPAGLCWMLLIALVGMALVAKQWWSAGLVGAALVLYTVAGNVWFANLLLARIEGEVLPGPDLATAEPFAAIFVLGGGTNLAPDGSAQLGEGGDRIVKAASLYLSGKTPLLVTGGQPFDGGRNLGVEVRTLWQSLGIPGSAVLIEPDPRITRTEVEQYHLLAVKNGWKRVGMVSSAWHLPRVLTHCRRLKWDVVAIASDARSRPKPIEFLWLIPQSHGFSRMEQACWELLGRMAGR